MTQAETDLCCRIERVMHMAVHAAMSRLTDPFFGPTTLEEQRDILVHDIMDVVRMLVTNKPE